MHGTENMATQADREETDSGKGSVAHTGEQTGMQTGMQGQGREDNGTQCGDRAINAST